MDNEFEDPEIDFGDVDIDQEEFAGYADNYSEEDFWDKLFKYAVKISRTLLEQALILFYALQDPNVPAWAKASILPALGYFIFPIDVIPDVIPVVGLTDDASVIAGVIALLNAYISPVTRKKHRLK